MGNIRKRKRIIKKCNIRKSQDIESSQNILKDITNCNIQPKNQDGSYNSSDNIIYNVNNLNNSEKNSGNSSDSVSYDLGNFMKHETTEKRIEREKITSIKKLISKNTNVLENILFSSSDSVMKIDKINEFNYNDNESNILKSNILTPINIPDEYDYLDVKSTKVTSEKEDNILKEFGFKDSNNTYTDIRPQENICISETMNTSIISDDLSFDEAYDAITSSEDYIKYSKVKLESLSVTCYGTSPNESLSREIQFCENIIQNPNTTDSNRTDVQDCSDININDNDDYSLDNIKLDKLEFPRINRDEYFNWLIKSGDYYRGANDMDEFISPPLNNNSNSTMNYNLEVTSPRNLNYFQNTNSNESKINMNIASTFELLNADLYIDELVNIMHVNKAKYETMKSENPPITADDPGLNLIALSISLCIIIYISSVFKYLKHYN